MGRPVVAAVVAVAGVAVAGAAAGAGEARTKPCHGDRALTCLPAPSRQRKQQLPVVLQTSSGITRRHSNLDLTRSLIASNLDAPDC